MKKGLFQALQLLAAAALILGSACAPQFFTSTNTDAPAITMSTAASPTGQGLFQGVIAPGDLCVGGLEPNQTLSALIDLGGDTTSRLGIWDGSQYRSIATNLTWAQNKMKDLILIDGITASAYSGVSFTFANADSYKPTLNLNLANLMTDTRNVGKIWNFRVLHEDPEDGHSVFYADGYEMAQDRSWVVRQGVDGDTASPSIQNFTVADGDSPAADVTFNLTVTEELGNLQAMIVQVGTTATGDEDYRPLVVTDIQRDGSGNRVYTLSPAKGISTGTSYVLLIARSFSSTAPDRPWWKEGMPISQDFSGNVLLDNSGKFETPQDMGTKIGIGTNNIMVYALDFTTDP